MNTDIVMKESHKCNSKAVRKKSKGNIFDTVNVIFMLIFSCVTIYPFWYILILSFNDGKDANLGSIWFWPRVLTLENYVYVFKYPNLQSAFVVTVARCILGAVLSVVVCMLAAYSLSKRFLPGRKAILIFFMMPMFIGGTIISNYVVMVKLGLMNNFFVYVLPGAFAFFSMIIMRTFIEGIPIDIEESAMLDGANYWDIFIRIILPLSKPIIAAFLFFGIVSGWLDLYTNLLFVTKRSLYTLQYILYSVINSSEATKLINFSQDPTAVSRMMQRASSSNVPTPSVIKVTVMVVVTFPILFVYPFFQKYFIKGMMVGAIKA
jgi:putative aldouronate transport system permease protein